VAQEAPATASTSGPPQILAALIDYRRCASLIDLFGVPYSRVHLRDLRVVHSCSGLPAWRDDDQRQAIRQAIDLARQARERASPVRRLLVADERVVLEAENTVVSQNNPTHHAELNGSPPGDVTGRVD
jgi:hypothetical protein